MARNWVYVRGYVRKANIEEKTRKSNAKSPHEESENHKNIRFQLQCNSIAILANKQAWKLEHLLTLIWWEWD